MSMPVQPNDMDKVLPLRGSFVHAQQSDNQSKANLTEEISRLQSAAKQYQMITYKVGDFVTEAGVMYRNTNAIVVPEVFTPTNWKAVDGPSVALEIFAVAVLGMSGDQNIPAMTATDVLFDESFVDGDLNKIVDEGNGIFKLHNGEFVLSCHVGADGSGMSARNLDLIWQSSLTLVGGYTSIFPPEGRAGKINIGNSQLGSQPKATAFVDASSQDVFVKLIANGSDAFLIKSIYSSASIRSHGTAAIANTPLSAKGDVLTHNGISEQRLPVSIVEGEVLTVDPAAPDGIKWGPRGLEVLADQTLAVNSPTFFVTFPEREFLYIIIFADNDGIDPLNVEFNFNDDFGDNYAFLRDENFGTVTTETLADRVPLDPSIVDENISVILTVFNQPGFETAYMTNSVCVDGAGTPAVLPTGQRLDGHWHNNAQVNKLTLSSVGGIAGDIGAGSRIIVMGSHV